MAELPSGTVTFLFTDIEGSTRMLTRLRGAYAEVLGEHQRLLRAAFAEHGGREVHTEGDAFFVAFARASDAVAAAVQAQRALASQVWTDGAQVRVRMGLHTGVAEIQADDYVGLDVHRAARICSAGHGGQVLISSATRALIADELSPDVALMDLGEHSLKDLDRPERLYQLVVGDLPAHFPPPASLSPSSDGLPSLPNATIGRADDVRAIVERLRVDGVRLLTLTGPGGVGKTRVAIEVSRAAHDAFADGASFVSLAAVRGPEDVPGAVVKALAIVVLSGESADEAATRFLSAKRMLLAADNFEHVMAAAPFIGRLLDACPHLSILATSREPLGLQAEERYPVPALAGDDAVALFHARARAHDPGFDLDDADAVADICRRVDGLPLAIELAAARCGLLSPAEIADRLEDALGVLGPGPRDAPERQRTLGATIDWSHELLTDAEKRCFARFAVFPSGATVQAAEAILHAGLDTLDSLVAKSLLTRVRGTPARLSMLETIRAYAEDCFAADPGADAVREEHYRHYLALAQRHGTEHALWGADAGPRLAALDADIDNLHAALGWAVARGDAEAALAMVAGLAPYWLARDRYAEAVGWIEDSLELPADADAPVRFSALLTKARCLWQLGRAAELPRVLDVAEALARRLGDPVLISQALRQRADHEIDSERLAAAEPAADEALQWARAAGDVWELAEAASSRAIASSAIAELRERVESAAGLLTAAGNVRGLSGLLSDATYAALCLGSERDAADFAARAIPLARAMDSPYARMIDSGNRGLAELLSGRTEAAADAFREELSLAREMVIRPVLWEALRGLAAVAVVHGDHERAATLLGAAGAHRFDQPEDPVTARLEDTFFAPARTRYGADAWDAATREGSALGFDEAISYALGV